MYTRQRVRDTACKHLKGVVVCICDVSTGATLADRHIASRRMILSELYNCAQASVHACAFRSQGSADVLLALTRRRI